MKQRLMLAAAMVLFASAAFAQEPSPAEVPIVNLYETIAYAINTVFVFVGLQLIKNGAPKLPAIVKQLLALAGGPVLMQFLGPAAAAALGYPVVFDTLAAALAGLASGATAIFAYDMRNGK